MNKFIEKILFKDNVVNWDLFCKIALTILLGGVAIFICRCIWKLSQL